MTVELGVHDSGAGSRKVCPGCSSRSHHKAEGLAWGWDHPPIVVRGTAVALGENDLTAGRPSAFICRSGIRNDEGLAGVAFPFPNQAAPRRATTAQAPTTGP